MSSKPQFVIEVERRSGFPERWSWAIIDTRPPSEFAYKFGFAITEKGAVRKARRWIKRFDQRRRYSA